MSYFTETSKIKVLVLDDDLLIRNLLLETLGDEFEFKAVATYKEFSEVFINFNPDILLLDILLPDINGIEICQELRQNSQYEKLIIFILTGMEKDKIIEECYMAGADDYISKPFIPLEVKSKIQRCKKTITYQNKLYASFNYQLEFSKRLYTLNRIIQKNINISHINLLSRVFESFNEILDIGFVELVIRQNESYTVIFRKNFDYKSYYNFHQLKEKIINLDNCDNSLIEKRIRSGEKEEIFCYMAPVLFNKEISGFLIVQSDMRLGAEDKNLIALSTDFLGMMLEKIMIHKQLNEQYRKYRLEISNVRKMQVSLLPDFKGITGFDIASTFLPAEDISGDFFDGFFLDDEVYQFIICDVSGHGIASSYIGNEFRSLFKSLSARKYSSAEIIRLVNQIVSRDISGLDYFGTMIVCQINIKTGEVIYASGGHPPGLYYSAQSACCNLLDNTGPIVGFFNDSEFTNLEFTMQTGDCLILYTDGIPETYLPDKCEDYGQERLMKNFVDNIGEPSQDIIQSIIGSVYEFSGYAQQLDDITMICIKKT